MPVLPLEKIRKDGGTQPRTYAEDAYAVEKYAGLMADGKVLPPPVVFFDGTDYWLVDGFHRVAAAARNGLTEMECEVTQGTLREAQWYSYSVNAEHGIPRSKVDTDRAIRAAIKHSIDHGMPLSYRAVAKHVGVDHKTVGAHWKAMEDSGEIPRGDGTKVCADGRVMNTAANQANRQAPPPPEESASERGTPGDDLHEQDSPDDDVEPYIQKPEGGWPKMEDGVYPTELAEPFFCNRGHAQAVIHVLQVEPLFWQKTPRWVANAGLVGVSGCELSMPLNQNIAQPSKEEAIAWAAQAMAVHILRCLQDESLLASRRITLENFLEWACEYGACRITAADRLKKEEKERDFVFVRLAEDVLFGVMSLTSQTSRDAKAFEDWGRIVTELIHFADAGEVEGHDEVLKLIEEVDEVEARMAAIVTALRSYKARGIAA